MQHIQNSSDSLSLEIPWKSPDPPLVGSDRISKGIEKQVNERESLIKVMRGLKKRISTLSLSLPLGPYPKQRPSSPPIRSKIEARASLLCVRRKTQPANQRHLPVAGGRWPQTGRKWLQKFCSFFPNILGGILSLPCLSLLISGSGNVDAFLFLFSIFFSIFLS